MTKYIPNKDGVPYRLARGLIIGMAIGVIVLGVTMKAWGAIETMHTVDYRYTVVTKSPPMPEGHPHPFYIVLDAVETDFRPNVRDLEARDFGEPVGSVTIWVTETGNFE
jgi:hypothetical protein